MIANNATVTNMLGVDDGAYFCQSAINESLFIIPILYRGITTSIAFLECTAWSKAIVAFLPAFCPNTIGPPGCYCVYLDRSYTLS